MTYPNFEMSCVGHETGFGENVPFVEKVKKLGKKYIFLSHAFSTARDETGCLEYRRMQISLFEVNGCKALRYCCQPCTLKFYEYRILLLTPFYAQCSVF